LLLYALFFTGDEANDADFVPPETHRGIGPMVEIGGSRGTGRSKRKAKIKKAPTRLELVPGKMHMKNLLRKLSGMIPTMFPMLI
jgi:hypothetical protein